MLFTKYKEYLILSIIWERGWWTFQSESLNRSYSGVEPHRYMSNLRLSEMDLKGLKSDKNTG